MKYLALALPLAALLLLGCQDSVSGFLSCGIDVCSAREECVETDNGPSCVCAEGFEGSACATCASGYKKVGANRCELIPIDCDDDPTVCGLHGTCVDKPAGDLCECDELYSGRLCELCESGYQDNDSDGICRATCAKAALDCKSPSHCSDARGTAVCDCPAGYTGDDCSRCTLGYRDSGSGCVQTCAAGLTKCSQNQVCVDDPKGARCACAEGFAGATCSSCAQGYREDPSTGSCLPSCDAEINSCGDHGVCDDSVGFAHCICNVGYLGEACAMCSDGFGSTQNELCQPELNDAQTLVMLASFQGRDILATLDPSAGAASPLAELASPGIASGSAPGSLLLNQLGTISQLTLPDGLTKMVVPSSGAVGPLAWDPTQERLYGLGGKAPYPVLSIDPVSKVVVELFDSNLAGVADLAFDALNNRLLALRDTVFAISLVDGAVSSLGAAPPGTMGIEALPDGTVLALAATDADEATSRVQACRASAARLEIAGYAGATGRFIQPAAAVDSVSVEAATSDTREVLSYLGRGASNVPRVVQIAVNNPEAVVCLALEEATRVEVGADASFRALVIYAADADVVLAMDPDVAAEPNIFLGGYAPSFTHAKRSDIVELTPQEWQARALPVDPRFHHPGPGVLHALSAGASLDVVSSTTLSGLVTPSGSLSSWTPLAP